MEQRAVNASTPYTWHGLEELREDVKRSLSRFDLCRSEVDDIVQEALLRAARYRHRLLDDERLRPWVMRIAMNVMRDFVRRDRRCSMADGCEELLDAIEGREVIPGEDNEDDLLQTNGEMYERSLLLCHLERALDELPRSDRRVLSRWYSGRDDNRPASRVCESSPGLARVHVFRARGRLVRILRKRLALAAFGGAVGELPRLPPHVSERRSARRAAVPTPEKERRGTTSAAVEKS